MYTSPLKDGMRHSTPMMTSDHSNFRTLSRSSIHMTDSPFEDAAKTATDGDEHLTPGRKIRFAPDLRKELQDIGPRPPPIKIYSVARKMRDLSTILRTKRNAASSQRAQLAHQQETLDVRLDYVAESLLLTSEALRTRESTPDASRQLVEADETRKDDEQERRCQIAMDDIDRFRESLQIMSKTRKDLDKADADIQAIEEKLISYAIRIAEEAPEDMDDDDDESEADTASIASGRSAREMPEEIDAWLDLVGDLRIACERLVNLRQEQQEQQDLRELLSEQERPVSPSTAQKSDATFTMHEEQLLDKVQNLQVLIDEARKRCEAKGYNVDKWLIANAREEDGDSITEEEYSREDSRPGSVDANTDPTTHTNESTLQPSVVEWRKSSIPSLTVDSNELTIDDMIAKALEPQPAAPLPVNVTAQSQIQNWLAAVEARGDITETAIAHALTPTDQTVPCGTGADAKVEASDVVSKSSAIHGSSQEQSSRELTPSGNHRVSLQDTLEKLLEGLQPPKGS